MLFGGQIVDLCNRHNFKDFALLGGVVLVGVVDPVFAWTTSMDLSFLTC